MARIPAPHLTQNKVQEAERQFNVKVDGIEAEVRFTIRRMEGGWWGQNEKVVLYSPNICFYTIFPYSELILSVNVVRVKLIRSHRNVLERRCRPEAFQCKLFSGGGREREREGREMRLNFKLRGISLNKVIYLLIHTDRTMTSYRMLARSQILSPTDDSG